MAKVQVKTQRAKVRPEHAHQIAEVSSWAPGLAVVRTKDGQHYTIQARDTRGVLPRLGQDVRSYKGAQPVFMPVEG